MPEELPTPKKKFKTIRKREQTKFEEINNNYDIVYFL